MQPPEIDGHTKWMVRGSQHDLANEKSCKAAGAPFYGVLRTTEWLTTFLSLHIVQTAIGFREHPVFSYERRMK
jgi:hypothetical protein